jgi:hypothetical protein
MGAAMKTIRVSRGTDGSTPRSPAAFVAIVHATFDSAEVFATAFARHAAELQGDAPSYTNIQPVVQIRLNVDRVIFCIQRQDRMSTSRALKLLSS